MNSPGCPSGKVIGTGKGTCHCSGTSLPSLFVVMVCFSLSVSLLLGVAFSLFDSVVVVFVVCVLVFVVVVALLLLLLLLLFVVRFLEACTPTSCCILLLAIQFVVVTSCVP